MTVKELIEILSACNEDAVIYLQEEIGFQTIKLEADDVWATPNGKFVLFLAPLS